MLYAAMIKDYYIFAANFPGFILGLFYSFSSLVVLSQSKSQSDSVMYSRLENLILVGSTYFCFLSMHVGITLDASQAEYGRNLVAYSGIVCCTCYYAAPCTDIAQILRTKNASSLYPPMLIANGANASLWMTYGYFTLKDSFVYGPNFVAVVLVCFQFSLVCIYGRTTH